MPVKRLIRFTYALLAAVMVLGTVKLHRILEISAETNVRHEAFDFYNVDFEFTAWHCNYSWGGHPDWFEQGFRTFRSTDDFGSIEWQDLTGRISPGDHSGQQKAAIVNNPSFPSGGRALEFRNESASGTGSYFAWADATVTLKENPASIDYTGAEYIEFWVDGTGMANGTWGLPAFTVGIIDSDGRVGGIPYINSTSAGPEVRYFDPDTLADVTDGKIEADNFINGGGSFTNAFFNCWNGVGAVSNAYTPVFRYPNGPIRVRLSADLFYYDYYPETDTGTNRDAELPFDWGKFKGIALRYTTNGYNAGQSLYISDVRVCAPADAGYKPPAPTRDPGQLDPVRLAAFDFCDIEYEAEVWTVVGGGNEFLPGQGWHTAPWDPSDSLIPFREPISRIMNWRNSGIIRDGTAEAEVNSAAGPRFPSNGGNRALASTLLVARQSWCDLTVTGTVRSFKDAEYIEFWMDDTELVSSGLYSYSFAVIDGNNNAAGIRANGWGGADPGVTASIRDGEDYESQTGTKNYSASGGEGIGALPCISWFYYERPDAPIRIRMNASDFYYDYYNAGSKGGAYPAFEGKPFDWGNFKGLTVRYNIGAGDVGTSLYISDVVIFAPENAGKALPKPTKDPQATPGPGDTPGSAYGWDLGGDGTPESFILEDGKYYHFTGTRETDADTVISVSDGVTAHITLENVSISKTGGSEVILVNPGGTLHVNLKGDNVLGLDGGTYQNPNSGMWYRSAGSGGVITVARNVAGTKIGTIIFDSEDGEGTLDAYSRGIDFAVIGSALAGSAGSLPCGKIVFNGGHITARQINYNLHEGGASSGAGDAVIGGVDPIIEINGGTVTASTNALYEGAPIGSGWGSHTSYNGTAKGGYHGAGTVTVTGGTVNASAVKAGAIGGGIGDANAPNIIITGGTVNVSSLAGAALGPSENGIRARRGYTRITGGTVNIMQSGRAPNFADRYGNTVKDPVMVTVKAADSGSKPVRSVVIMTGGGEIGKTDSEGNATFILSARPQPYEFEYVCTDPASGKAYLVGTETVTVAECGFLPDGDPGLGLDLAPVVRLGDITADITDAPEYIPVPLTAATSDFVPPSRLDYTRGELIDLSGMSAAVNYTNGTAADVTARAVLSPGPERPFDAADASAGTVEYTVSLDGEPLGGFTVNIAGFPDQPAGDHFEDFLKFDTDDPKPFEWEAWQKYYPGDYYSPGTKGLYGNPNGIKHERTVNGRIALSLNDIDVPGDPVSETGGTVHPNFGDVTDPGTRAVTAPYASDPEAGGLKALKMIFLGYDPVLTPYCYVADIRLTPMKEVSIPSPTHVPDPIDASEMTHVEFYLDVRDFSAGFAGGGVSMPFFLRDSKGNTVQLVNDSLSEKWFYHDYRPYRPAIGKYGSYNEATFDAVCLLGRNASPSRDDAYDGLKRIRIPLSSFQNTVFTDSEAYTGLASNTLDGDFDWSSVEKAGFQLYMQSHFKVGTSIHLIDIRFVNEDHLEMSGNVNLTFPRPNGAAIPVYTTRESIEAYLPDEAVIRLTNRKYAAVPVRRWSCSTYDPSRPGEQFFTAMLDEEYMRNELNITNPFGHRVIGRVMLSGMELTSLQEFGGKITVGFGTGLEDVLESHLPKSVGFTVNTPDGTHPGGSGVTLPVSWSPASDYLSETPGGYGFVGSVKYDDLAALGIVYSDLKAYCTVTVDTAPSQETAPPPTTAAPPTDTAPPTAAPPTNTVPPTKTALPTDTAPPTATAPPPTAQAYGILNIAAGSGPNNVKIYLDIPDGGMAVLITAAYDADGRFLCAAANQAVRGENDAVIDAGEGTVLIKAMLWDSLGSMEPLCPHRYESLILR